MLPDKPRYASKSHTFLKAEAFIAALLANGFSFDRLVTERNGSFTKSYHKDIEDVKSKADDNGNPILHIQINRDSIYDRLPEGLFHQPRAHGATVAGVGQMVAEYKRFREEEKAARKFFQPIEHELLRYATVIEEQEREMLWGVLSGNLNNAFSRFWNLQEGLPAVPSSVLVRIMPWAHLIKGNRLLCGKALEMMLEKPVTVTERLVHEHTKDDDTFSLGGGSLGVDTVAGKHFHETAVTWVFSIQGLTGAQIMEFMDHAPYGRFLQQFIDIFIPIEIDATFEYELERHTAAAEMPILGYSMTL